MSFYINATLREVAAPPIADAQSWVAGRTFAADRPLLDVSQAVPSYAPAHELQAHLAQQVMQPLTALYTGIAGLPELRQELAAELSRDYAGTVSADNVALTAGCNEAFAVAMMALAEAGDEVLLPLPYYFNQQMWLQTLGIRPVTIPFNADNHGTPDIGAIAARITARTRALVLVTPNNPTGAIYSAEFIEQCFELAKAHGFALVLDETYRDFRTDTDTPPHRLFARPDWTEALVHLYSFSKAYALTGYRVGSLTAGPLLQAQISKLLDCITICPPRIGQLAALYGLRHLAGWRDDKRRIMLARNTLMQSMFAQPLNGFRLVSSGAYFAYLEHPFAGVSSYDVARHLADAHDVLCLPGTMFGPGQQRFLRVAFANLDNGQIAEFGRRLQHVDLNALS